MIAACLQKAGFYIGTDLNIEKDNLWFTLLFKQYDILSSSEEEFDELLRILITRMTGQGSFTKAQISLTKTLASKDREQLRAHWLAQRAVSLLSKKTEMKEEVRWGWKEPTSHIVLDRLIDRLDNMKYIHVVRNGLDMAYSDNQRQLRLWGPHFINEPFDVTPYYSLRH